MSATLNTFVSFEMTFNDAKLILCQHVLYFLSSKKPNNLKVKYSSNKKLIQVFVSCDTAKSLKEILKKYLQQ